MKKKLFTLLFCSVLALTASAEGYQVNSLSARQNGMGHVGTAMHLGAESQFFNPAGMGFMDKKLDISGSFTAIISKCYAKVDGTEYTTNSPASTPINAMLAFSVYDFLKFGVAFYTPYGSNINWGESWPGAPLNQSVKLSVYTVQPTVAWRPLKGLSVGVGLTINWGSVNLNKALIMGSSGDQALIAAGLPAMFGNNALASVNLTGNASPRVGVNVGIMWDINDKWTVGFDFRSRVDMRVKAGTANLSTAPSFEQLAALAAKYPQFAAIGLLNKLDKASFAAQMPCAAVYRFGVAYRPIKPLIVSFDAQLTGWNAYKALDITFADEIAKNFNQHIEKNYKNSWLFSLGAEYAVSNRFDVRCGLIVDTTPCNKDYYNPETPGMTKIEPSVGLTFRPISCLSINAAFLYVHGLGAKDRACPYQDLVLGERTFRADYRLRAFCPSIGIRFEL